MNGYGTATTAQPSAVPTAASISAENGFGFLSQGGAGPTEGSGAAASPNVDTADAGAEESAFGFLNGISGESGAASTPASPAAADLKANESSGFDFLAGAGVPDAATQPAQSAAGGFDFLSSNVDSSPAADEAPPSTQTRETRVDSDPFASLLG